MLDWMKKRFAAKKADAPRTSGPQLAMPLLATPAALSAPDVVAAWARLFPQLPALRTEAPSSGDGPLTFAAGDRSLFVMQMPLPVPTAEVIGAVRSSWMWQVADEPVRQHQAHAIVTTLGSDDPVADAWNVARLSACVLEAGRGVALYWGSACQVHVPKLVADFAASDTPPVPLWVGITLSAPASEGPFSAATHGLEALGHKEFEVLETRMGVGELRMTLLDLAGYVLGQGPVLLDGQTFGRTAEERWPIRHQPSRLVKGREAILLGIP
jgi:hypothetical protein